MYYQQNISFTSELSKPLFQFKIHVTWFTVHAHHEIQQINNHELY
jgi:hypothetical protein